MTSDTANCFPPFKELNRGKNNARSKALIFSVWEMRSLQYTSTYKHNNHNFKKHLCKVNQILNVLTFLVLSYFILLQRARGSGRAWTGCTAPCPCWSQCRRPRGASATTRAGRARTSGGRRRLSSEWAGEICHSDLNQNLVFDAWPGLYLPFKKNKGL